MDGVVGSPLVSIVVPCFNVERFVAECLDSILKQTYENIEIICVNDGSQDGTLGIINSFAKQDSRIIVIDKTNSGCGASVNLGLSRAKGKYVGIVESDDYVDPDMLEVMVGAAETCSLEMVKAGFYITYKTYEEEKWVLRAPENKVFSSTEEEGIFFEQPAIWSGLYLKSFLLENGIKFLETPGASYQDTSFNFKCNLMCKRCMVLHKCFLHYRQHEQNSIKSGGKVYAICDEYDEIVNYAKRKNKFSDFEKGIILALLMGGYKWNFQRLPWGKEKVNFVNRWSLDLKRLKGEGVMPNERLGSKKKLDYKTILHFPSLYVLRYRIKDLCRRS